MTTSLQNGNVADYYFSFLKNSSSDSKLDLISKLSQSLKEGNSEPETSLQTLFRAYQSEETAAEIIASLKV